MTVEKSSIFSASKETVFRILRHPETLQTIAKPYAAFEPIGEAVSNWEVGGTSAYRLRLFGVIPYGTHMIRILRFDPDGVISRELNDHVPVWNHEIRLTKKDENHTRYTDRVENHAGWKTFFIWLWANAFYAHRQRKWIRLLQDTHQG